MFLTEIISEDSFYPPEEQNNTVTEEEISAFVNEWLNNEIGIPPARFSVWSDNISMSIPKQPTDNPKYFQRMKDDWYQSGLDLIEELRINEFGHYEIATVNPWLVTIVKN